MVTVNDVLERADRIRPNMISDEDKAEWLNHIEGRVCKELFKEEYVPFTLPEGTDRELKLKEPYDDVYNWYMYAMIDIAHREYQIYDMDMTLFNAAWKDAETDLKNGNRQNYFKNIVP